MSPFRLSTLIWVGMMLNGHTNGQSLFTGLNNGPEALAVMCLHADSVDPYLYLAGNFHLADDTVVCPGIMRWDGQGYSALGCGLEWDCTTPFPGPSGGPPVFAITRWGGDLYVGGYFPLAGGDSAQNIARWDGANWHPLGGGLSTTVKNIRVLPDGLYATGWFEYLDDTIPAYGFARWDGSAWHAHPVPPQFSDGKVNDVAYYKGELYIGGNFGDPDGRNDIAKFNGTEWVSLDGQGFLGIFSTVNKLIVHDSLLYVGGSFADYPPYGDASNPGNGIVAWNGVDWVDLGTGTRGSSNATVSDMVWNRDTLYAVGMYDRIDGLPCDRLAKWEGTRWCALTPADYTTNAVGAIAFFRDTLHIGGTFDLCGPDSINRVAKWVGGAYVDSCGFGVGIPELPIADQALRAFPNPVSDQLTVSWQGRTASATIVIHDATGREMLRTRWHEDGRVDVARFAAGVYHLALLDPQGRRLVAVPFVKE